MRSHNNSKPYKCDICNVGYGHMCSLKLHMQKHVGDFVDVPVGPAAKKELSNESYTLLQLHIPSFTSTQ